MKQLYTTDTSSRTIQNRQIASCTSFDMCLSRDMYAKLPKCWISCSSMEDFSDLISRIGMKIKFYFKLSKTTCQKSQQVYTWFRNCFYMKYLKLKNLTYSIDYIIDSFDYPQDTLRFVYPSVKVVFYLKISVWYNLWSNRCNYFKEVAEIINTRYGNLMLKGTWYEITIFKHQMKIKQNACSFRRNTLVFLAQLLMKLTL